MVKHRHVSSLTSRRRSLTIQPRPEAREDEKGAVESELQELRDVVQSQSEELHELRTRLAALEAGGTTSKDAPASSPAGIIQPSTSAATTGVSTRQLQRSRTHPADQTKTSHRCRSKLVRRNLLRVVFLISPRYIAAPMLAAVLPPRSAQFLSTTSCRKPVCLRRVFRRSTLGCPSRLMPI